LEEDFPPFAVASASPPLATPAGGAAIGLQKLAQLHEPRPPARPLVPIVRSKWWDSAFELDTTNFKAWFRIPQGVFHHVCTTIKGHSLFVVPTNIGARAIPIEKQLACFLLRVGSALP
jgi:hypothetical protein